MNAELIEYYVNLLIIQYHDKPKARGHIEALIKALMVYDVAIQLRDGFDIDTAVGPQLDILGLYLGSDRIVTGTAFTREYFGYSEYGESAPFAFNGFMGYGGIAPDVQYRSYKESQQSLYSLNDAEYRTILKLKIIKNNGIPSGAIIDDILAILFGDSVIFTDRQNMTISYIFSETNRRLAQIAKSEDLLPRPSAVGISVSFAPDIFNIFAYSTYGGEIPDFAVGYAQYGITPIGGWAHYG